MCLWVLKFCFVSCFCINIVTTRNFVNVASKCFDIFFSAFGLNWNIAKMSFNVTCSEKTVDIALKEICAQYYYFSAFKILRPYLIWQEYIIFPRLCLKNIGKVCWFPYHFLWRYYTSLTFNFLLLVPFFFCFLFNSILTWTKDHLKKINWYMKQEQKTWPWCQSEYPGRISSKNHLEQRVTVSSLSLRTFWVDSNIFRYRPILSVFLSSLILSSSACSILLLLAPRIGGH